MTDAELLALNALADKLLEECERRRLGLAATLERFLPPVCRALGAVGAQVTARNEDMVEQTVRWGGQGPNKIAWRLDVAGRLIGRAAFFFPSDERRPAAQLKKGVAIVCEQLDDALAEIQTSAFKQQLVERMGRALTRHVFDEALDDAVAALARAVPFRRFALVYLDDEESESGLPRYRIYDRKKCTHHSQGAAHAGIEAVIRREGQHAIEPGRDILGAALKAPGAATTTLIAGVAKPRPIGQAVVDVPAGLDTFGRDLLHIFANAVTQRLVDYNRERRHLSQFFSPSVIDELIGQRGYQRHLAPRVERIGLLYADINSFTKLCEKALKKPDRIGAFVDLWSGEAVKIVWKHGGIFDKMVGDCVIGHFGPPFFRKTEKELAQAALAAAFEIQEFTTALGRKPEFRGLAPAAGLKGLGVAIGLNVCSAAVGLFGPNQDFTAFSSGMNQTARLQSQAGFRETVVMENVRKLLGNSAKARFEGPLEAAVKNVGKPLRYYKTRRA